MTADPAARPRILHVCSRFADGDTERRTVRLINAFGPKVAHAIVSAVPRAPGAAGDIARAITVDWPSEFPALQGRPTPARLKKLAEAMRGYDLILTYGWGAMDAVMAHTLLGQTFGLPPLVHHEDGFEHDERDRLKTTRNWYRRIGLGRARGLVVPSETLEDIALRVWEQPLGRVKVISPGVDTEAFAKPPRADALPGLIKRSGEFWVGTCAELDAANNLPALVRVCAPLAHQWHLVIVGEGPDRESIRVEAERLGVEHRVHLPGHTRNAERFQGLFDIFALGSQSDPFPIAVVEAMAAGRPVAGYATGDVAQMVADENRPFVVSPGDEAALSDALLELAADSDLRATLRKANRTKARAAYDEKAMIAAYRRLYASAMGRPALP